MRRLIVKINENFCGLWPRKVDLYVATFAQFPQVGEPVVIESVSGHVVADDVFVESVDVDKRIYTVRIW
jgi:hypothetical protein